MSRAPAFILISGLSGAGKSTALHALEDLGLFCTDNLPLEMLPEWAERMQARGRHAAVCVDARSTASAAELCRALEGFRARPHWHLLYVEAGFEALQRRFSTLRRRHPFLPEGDLPEAIRAEQAAFAPVRELSDLVFDSGGLTPYELGNMVESFWLHHVPRERSEIVCSLVSFSYQRGLPQDADMVVDARFLPNPHYVPELAPLTGKDAAVGEFFAGCEELEALERRLRDWLSFIRARLRAERKQYFTLAVGCSGGRHRSVHVVERLAAWMEAERLARPHVRHRELGEKRAPEGES